MGRWSLSDELRDVGESLMETFHCNLEGEADENGEQLEHDELRECWHCWGRYLVNRSRRRSTGGG